MHRDRTSCTCQLFIYLLRRPIRRPIFYSNEFSTVFLLLLRLPSYGSAHREPPSRHSHHLDLEPLADYLIYIQKRVRNGLSGCFLCTRSNCHKIPDPIHVVVRGANWLPSYLPLKSLVRCAPSDHFNSFACELCSIE